MRRIGRYLLAGLLLLSPMPQPGHAGSAERLTPALRHKLGQMLLVGFRGTRLAPDSFIAGLIRDLRIGGVVLFDFDVPSRSSPRNILDGGQVKRLTADLQAGAVMPLLIAVDAEGGRVNRLKAGYGFLDIPSPRVMAGKPVLEIERIYRELAEQLAGLGINLNLAPVVDLDLNPDNPIIGGLERSFSEAPAVVIDLARIFIKAHRRAGVATCLKHYPGHGSSRDDSHQGLVDVTRSYRGTELLPYRNLIREGLADMIMTAHIVNRRIDPDYPATLSPAHLRSRLRDGMGFQGVIISDDIQMGAVTEHYGEGEAAVRAVNAGCDILAVANNGSVYDEGAVHRVFDALAAAVKDGAIPIQRIEKAYQRIIRLKQACGIIGD